MLKLFEINPTTFYASDLAMYEEKQHKDNTNQVLKFFKNPNTIQYPCLECPNLNKENGDYPGMPVKYNLLFS